MQSLIVLLPFAALILIFSLVASAYVALVDKGREPDRS